MKIDGIWLEVPNTLHFKAAAANGNYIGTPVGPRQRVHREDNATVPRLSAMLRQSSKLSLKPYA